LRDIEFWQKYYDADYWERGPETGKSNYAKWHIYEPWDDKFIDYFNGVVPLFGKRVLDLGCALGGIVNALLKQDIEAYGLDLSEYAVKKGHQTHPRLLGRTYVGSAHEIPFLPGYFDVIHSNQVFEHIPEELVPSMLSEIYRVMKPGAVAWVGLVLGDGAREQDNPDHITIKPLEWWVVELEAAGLMLDMSIDDAFRASGLGFFDEYGWDSFSFRKVE